MRMYKTIRSIEKMQQIIDAEDIALFYISSSDCGVCKVLKPQIENLFNEKFPKISLNDINSSETPEIAAQMSIFTVPTILIYCNGQESVRESRSISLDQFTEKVSRIYSLFFSV